MKKILFILALCIFSARPLYSQFSKRISADFRSGFLISPKKEVPNPTFWYEGNFTALDYQLGLNYHFNKNFSAGIFVSKFLSMNEYHNFYDHYNEWRKQNGITAPDYYLPGSDDIYPETKIKLSSAGLTCRYNLLRASRLSVYVPFYYQLIFVDRQGFKIATTQGYFIDNSDVKKSISNFGIGLGARIKLKDFEFTIPELTLYKSSGTITPSNEESTFRLYFRWGFSCYFINQKH